jgi:hypothetical protein
MKERDEGEGTRVLKKQIKNIKKEMVHGFFFYLSTKPLVNQIKPPVH